MKQSEINKIIKTYQQAIEVASSQTIAKISYQFCKDFIEDMSKQHKISKTQQKKFEESINLAMVDLTIKLTGTSPSIN